MANYELALVATLPVDTEAGAVLKADIEKLVKKVKGKVISLDEWGERPLAYNIGKQDHGYYLIYQLELQPGSANKLIKLIHQDKRLLRVLLFALSDTQEK